MGERVLEAPSVAWAAREMERYQKGDRREKPVAWSGKICDVQVLEGVARVSEDLVMVEDTRDQGATPTPLWHHFVLSLGFRDVTPASQPPKEPLPARKPHREAERARLEELGVDLHRPTRRAQLVGATPRAARAGGSESDA